jgi:hypothetical protein
MSQEGYERLAVWSSCGVLSLAAVGKLWTAAGNMKILDFYYPLWLVRNRTLLLVVGIVEVLCCIRIFTGKSNRSSGVVLLWLASNFLIYHIAVKLSGAPMPCPCFGTLGARLGLSRESVDRLVILMALYLMCCGWYLVCNSGLASSGNPNLRGAHPKRVETVPAERAKTGFFS